ncbi:MAG: hypothetical protein ACREB9_06685 [Thermoplasmata archaeon]
MVGHMNEALNDVRKWEHRRLTEAGGSPLGGTRFWWRAPSMPNNPQVRDLSWQKP